jgi:hypothetical protein
MGIYPVYSLANDCLITGTRSEENGPLIREMRISKLWSHRLPKLIPELAGGSRETIYCTLDELRPMRQIYEIQIEVWYSVPLLGRRCRAAEFEAIPKTSGDEYIWEHRGNHACATESDLAIVKSPSLE